MKGEVTLTEDRLYWTPKNKRVSTRNLKERK